MALYSIRLDQASEDALGAAARARKVTRAVILREAITEYGRAAGHETTPLDRLSPLIGVIQDGPGNLSERTGQRFAALLSADRERTTRRPGAKRAGARRKVH